MKTIFSGSRLFSPLALAALTALTAAFAAADGSSWLQTGAALGGPAGGGAAVSAMLAQDAERARRDA